MKVLEYLKKNGNEYAMVLVPSVIAILSALTLNKIVSVGIIVFVLIIAICLVNISLPVEIPNDKRIKSQWDLFGLLLERHKQLMKQFLFRALFLLFLIILFFFAVLYFKKEELICLIRQCWWIISFYLSLLFTFYSIYLGVHFYAKRDYNLVQMLWAQIETLRDELESKNLGGLKDNLDEFGNQKLYHLMLKLRDGKMPNDFSREEIENMIDAEATIIEQIKVKVENANWPSFWNKLYYNFKKSI